MADFYAQIIIHTLVGILASTVKNPTSSKAIALRHYVQEAADACNEFLAATGGVAPSK